MKRAVKAILAMCLASVMVFALSGCSSNSYTPSLKDSTIDSSALVTEGTLTVGVNASNAPFAFQQDGKIVGLDVDVAAALADQMGLKLQITDVGSDPNTAIKNGTVDIVMGIQKTDTSVDAWLSDAYLSTATALFSTDENASLPSKSSSTTIAAQTSSVSANEVVDQFGSDFLTSTQDLQTAFSDLDDGTVKYVAADAVAGSYIANQSSSSAKIVGLMEKPTGYCVGVSSSNTTLKTEIANAMANISDQGILSVIQQSWLGSALDLSSCQLTSDAKSAKATSTSTSTSSSSSSTASAEAALSSESTSSSTSGNVSNVGANAASIG